MFPKSNWLTQAIVREHVNQFQEEKEHGNDLEKTEAVQHLKLIKELTEREVSGKKVSSIERVVSVKESLKRMLEIADYELNLREQEQTDKLCQYLIEKTKPSNSQTLSQPDWQIQSFLYCVVIKKYLLFIYISIYDSIYDQRYEYI